MQGRLLWWSLAVLLLACVVAGIRSCGHDDAAPPAAATQADGGDSAGVAKDGENDVEAAKLRARIKQHDEALYAAVATLQRYLAALGGKDRARADAFWVGKRAPADPHEADLRTLENLRGLRIENGRPKALDAQAVPSALEIPVELRVSIKGEPLRRYRGRYRLRRAVVDGHWEITSASIDAVRRPE